MDSSAKRGQSFHLPITIWQIAHLAVANLVDRAAAIKLLRAAAQAEHRTIAN